MNDRTNKLDVGVYILLFGLALFFRLIKLGNSPLSDYEAIRALISWEAVLGEHVQVGSNPGYFALTTSLFYLFGSSNFLARFLPALAGSLVVWLPFGFRRDLGREAAWIMGFGLALDPGMVAVSRIASGPMMALGFASVGVVFIKYRRLILAGIFGGLALISGPSIYLGVMGFLVAYWIARWFGFLPQQENLDDRIESPVLPDSNYRDRQQGLVAAALTALLVVTLFGRFPQGIGGWGNSLATFLQGWVKTPMVPVFQPTLAVVFYQPLALLFALVTIGRGWLQGRQLERWLSIWLLAALTLTVIYSQRNVFDSIWALLPLWALASRELSRYFRLPDLPAAGFGQAVLLFVLALIFWLVSISPGLGRLTWLVLLVVPVLALLTTVFVGLGWSWDAAKMGAVWGICLILGVYSLSAMLGASQRGRNMAEELWHPMPGTGQADLLRETLAELALRETGQEDWIRIVSLVDSPSLRWSLRDIQTISYLPTLEPGTLPTVIIDSDGGSDLSQTMSYLGQDFLWYNRPGWSGPLPQPLWPWVTSRSAPVKTESIVLWARSDLFPGELGQASEGTEDEAVDLAPQVEDGAPE